jgi:septum formation protein
MVLLRGLRRPILLASGSPRRSQILAMMGISFETVKSGVADEDEDAYIDLNDLDRGLWLRRLARDKARDASRRRPEALVLGADTVVVKSGEVLAKPTDKDDAAGMLRKLSGARHTVITGVALLCGETGFCESAAARTDVFFRELGDDEIEHYLSFPEYKDKAGSYAVQGGGMTFIDRIEGCYYNVMGLPVTATLGLLRDFIRKESGDVRE